MTNVLVSVTSAVSDSAIVTVMDDVCVSVVEAELCPVWLVENCSEWDGVRRIVRDRLSMV